MQDGYDIRCGLCIDANEEDEEEECESKQNDSSSTLNQMEACGRPVLWLWHFHQM